MPILGASSSGGSRPSAPVIGSATDGGTGTTASVAFTPSTYIGKGTITYTATSSPGNLTGTGSSPITVSGLTTGTAYTFTVRGTTNSGVASASSSASNSVTPATPTSFESIATFTGNGSSGSITFSSIPQTYRALQIRWTGRTTASQTNTDLYVQFNSVSNGYINHSIQGNGVVVETKNDTGGSSAIIYNSLTGNSATSGQMGVGVMDIEDYTSTTRKKTFRAYSGQQRITQGGIRSTSGMAMYNTAISSITLTIGSGNWDSNSSVALYGIKGA